MISRRKFLRAGALFLPATAIGQIAVNRRLYTEPPYGPADYMRFGAYGGSGWKGPAALTFASGGPPSPVVRSTDGGAVPGLSGTLGGTGSWEWNRQPVFLSNWTQIRIAFLLSIDATAASYAGMNLMMGVTNNFKLWGAASSNFIGHMMGGGNTWTQVPHSGTPYYTTGATDRYLAINNSGATTFVSGGGSPDIWATNANRRSLIMVDILKGAPSFTIQSWSNSTDANMICDFDRNDLQTAVNAAGGAAVTIKGSTLSWFTLSNAFTETNALDTIKFCAQATGANTTLCGVAVRKIS